MRSAEQRLAEFAAKPGTPSNLLDVQAFFDTIPTPEGFTRSQDTVPPWREGLYPPVPRLIFERAEDIRIEIHLSEDGLLDDWISGSGHTTFAEEPGSSVRFTFDRHGIEDSFYVDAENTGADVSVKIAEQIQQVAESRARHRDSVPVPGLPGGWTVTPDSKTSIQKQLRERGTHTFMPSGFGTGYMVFRSTRKQTYARALPASTMEFFGLTGRWFYQTVDAD